jgi:NitT/TauT family transport system permease protein
MSQADRRANRTPDGRNGIRLIDKRFPPVHPVVALAAGGIVWEAAGRSLGFRFLPPLSSVVAASWQMIESGILVEHLRSSVASLAFGYGLAVAVGLPLGALMGRHRSLEHALDFYLHAFLASPNLIYIPILFAIFGVGRGTQVALVFLYSFFVVAANTMAGVRAGDSALEEMARAFGAREWQLLRAVVLPAALPLIMAGLRLGMGRAVKGMINGEMFIALTGLGAMIRTYGGRFEADRVLGVLLVIVTLAVTAVGSIQWMERRATRWAERGVTAGR